MTRPAPTQAPAAAEDPYVGLTHFSEEDADRFFGRDTECALIIGNLRAARLTLLYAESGVGKSSLLRAGVVARLHGAAAHDVESRGAPRLLPVVFSAWSERPVAALVRAVAEAALPYLEEGESLDLPEDDLERALAIAGEALDTTLLVILDQFEEYFLYPEAGKEEARVPAQIARCVNRPGLRANFLISIRQDSYSRLGDLFRGQLTNVYSNFLHLDFLDRAGARESIERPIERLGELHPEAEPYALEPALVEAVLDQVRREPPDGSENGQPGGDDGEEIETTYLQLVMRRLWEIEADARSRRLRLSTLEEQGGAQEIIRGHLDRAMGDENEGGAGLAPDQRRVAAAIFHFLVTPGGTKIALTAKDLADYSKLPQAEVDPVLRYLSSPSLHILRPVVSADGQGDPRFEIFHDALAQPIVEWRTRVEEEQLAAQLERERAERRAAQQAAAEAEARAASERRRKRLALTMLAVAIVALLAGAAYFAVDQRQLADRRDADATSVRATERIGELTGAPNFGPAAAALASLEAYRLSPTSEARNQVLSLLQRNAGLPALGSGHTRGINSVAYWPDSEKLATTGYDNTIRLWDALGNKLGKDSPIVLSGVPLAVDVGEAADGKSQLVAAGMAGSAVVLREVDDGGKVGLRRRLPAPTLGAVLGLAFDPRRPQLLAAAGDGGGVALWDVGDPANPVRRDLAQVEGEVSDLAFAADGRLLLASDRGGLALGVSGTGFAERGPVTVEPRWVDYVATARNGSVAFGGTRGIYLRDAPHGRRLHLRLPMGVSSLAFARGGSVLVSAGTDWNVITWDVASGRPFGPPRGLNWGKELAVAVSPDGETIASGGDDRQLKVWPLDPARALATTVGGLSPREARGNLPYVMGLAVGGRGRVAAAGEEGTTIWTLPGAADTSGAPRPLTWIPGGREAVAYDGDLLVVARGDSFVVADTGPECTSMPAEPCQLAVPEKPHSKQPVSSLALGRVDDRRLLVSSGFRNGEGVLNLWDLTETASTGEIDYLDYHQIESAINQVAFHPPSSLAAAAAEDGVMRVWDVSADEFRGMDIDRARGNEAQSVNALAFSPDGSLLASGGNDQQVVLWKVAADRSTVEETPGTLFHTQTVLSLAFSPDGEMLAAGDGEGTTCLYEVESRHAIGECLPGHSTDGSNYGGTRALAFASAGGRTSLLTAGLVQPVLAWAPILWAKDDSEQIEEAIAADVCALAGGNLTRYEWGAVFGNTMLADDRHKTCPEYPLPD